MNSFKEVYGYLEDSAYLAPARVNLIGEHIDYNGGLVFPCAISLATKCYFKKRNDNKINLYSKNTDLFVKRSLDDISYKAESDWANYPIGIIKILKDRGFIVDKGFDAYFESNIPLGSGLSSSASILVLTCYMLKSEYNFDISNEDIAKIAQETEIKYCGLSCGIMDQAIIALGKENKAMLLDCAKFKYEYYDFNLGDYTLVVMATNKRRALTESKYNERVEECNKALKLLNDNGFKLNNLCEFNPDLLDKAKNIITDQTIYKRFLHVVLENKRVIDFKNALLNKDIKLAAKLINESDYSLKNNYEVTGVHLDTITDLARKNEACIGARMTGAGFGGCAIAIVLKDKVNEFMNDVSTKYEKQLGIKPSFYICDIIDGPRKIK